MRILVFFTSLVLSAACFAPHYTTWGGTSYDVVQVENIRRMLASVPAKELHRFSSGRQIEGIRSWLVYGPGKSMFVNMKIERPASNPALVIDIAREMRIDVETDAFMAAIKSTAWDRSPIKPAKPGSGIEEPWWVKPSPTRTKDKASSDRNRPRN